MARLLKKVVLALAALAVLGTSGVAVAQRVQLTLDNTASLPGGNEDTYKVVMLKGQMAEVRATGDGGTDLDLFIYDEDGRLVTQDVGLDDRCVCTWRVPQTHVYTVKVKNLGAVANRYRITSN